MPADAITNKGPRGKDLTGIRFGRWTVISLSGTRRQKNYTRRFWNCVCVCGAVRKVSSMGLLSGSSKSCGCMRLDIINRPLTHGHVRNGRSTKTYRAWIAMKQRCLNPKHKYYKHYGGRGIRVCRRWLKFENFLEDMGIAPPGLSIERINNKTGNYTPSNCKWDTVRNQSRNRRNNVIVRFNGKSQVLQDWAHELGMIPGSLRARFKYGWSVKRALTEPIHA